MLPDFSFFGFCLSNIPVLINDCSIPKSSTLIISPGATDILIGVFPARVKFCFLDPKYFKIPISLVCCLLRGAIVLKNFQLKITDQEILWEFIKANLGKPYIWGGQSSLIGFDCSGFVQEALACIGLDPKGDQTANALCDKLFDNVNSNHKCYLDDVVHSIYQFGDILFYGKNGDSLTNQQISHVAIAINQKTMVEAGGGGSKTKTVLDAEKTNSLVRFRPIHSRRDLVCGFRLFL